jgi:hypothetical protein
MAFQLKPIFFIPTLEHSTVKSAIYQEIQPDLDHIWLDKTTDRGWMIINLNDQITPELIQHIMISTARYACNHQTADMLAKACGVHEWQTGKLYGV